ncbi:hypothetical protein [Georgenia faecalis]|uniref:Tetratricopeptide repeat protein n=1 Tax=Georgenia faecalis TaxID=2483799 RepID=A0ABV9DA21_9MICO|nr:hypothetical protein [Georgenia faecalis]
MATLSDVDRYILAARLKGYLANNQDALAILSEGLHDHPDDVRLLQLRGIKRLIARDLPGALSDLTRAADGLGGLPDSREFYRSAVEQDVVNLVLGRGERVRDQRTPVDELPDAAHAARGTLHATTWHHLGLARYLTGDFAGAAEAFSRARRAAVDDHQIVTALDWEYMSLRRAGRDEEAAAVLPALDDIAYDPELLDSPSVPNTLRGWYVQRLRMYRGELRPQDLLKNDVNDPLAIATLGHGVGTWYLYNGHPAAAKRAFLRVLELGDPTSVGHLAAGRESIVYDSRSFSSNP